MTQTVTMPDGTIHNFPAEATPDMISSALGLNKEKPSRQQAIGGLIGKVSQGASMGLGDEIQAGRIAPFRYIGAQLAGKDTSLKDAYTAELSRARGDLKAAEQRYPIESVIAEIGGGIAPGALAYKAAGKAGLTSAKTFWGRRGRESLLGALGSGVYGFNTGEGDSRTPNASSSAIAGAFASPVLGFGLEKLSPLGNFISTALTPTAANGQTNQIAQQLKRAIDSGDEATKNQLLAQLNAGKAKLPYEVPLSQGNLNPTLQNQAIEEMALKGASGNEPLRMMQEFTGKQNQALRSNISALIRDNDLPANAVGDDIVEGVAKAYQGARAAKNAAYDTAKPLMDNAWVFKNELKGFGNQMDDVLMDYPSDVAAKIRREFDIELARGGKNATNIPFSRIEAFRKKLNNLGAMGTPESAAGSAIKSRLDKFLNSGVITGEQAAVAAINAARVQSAAIKRTFQTKQASPLVREIVASVDNNSQLAPEKIFQAISTGNSKQNANNVKSLVKILGEDSPTVGTLRDSILKDVRDSAMDSSGYISPAKLAGNIDRLIYSNKSVAEQLLSPNEIATLKSLQEVSRKIAYKAPGVVNNSNSANIVLRQLDALSRTFVGRNTPLFSTMVNSLKEASAANRVGQSISPVLEAKPIFGGAGELLQKKMIMQQPLRNYD
jgi:hypothetical protein